jgi:hypothetical protein
VGVPTPPGAVSGPQFPPDLARVVAAWDRLPEAIKAGVLALVQASGGQCLARSTPVSPTFAHVASSWPEATNAPPTPPVRHVANPA